MFQLVFPKQSYHTEASPGHPLDIPDCRLTFSPEEVYFDVNNMDNIVWLALCGNGVDLNSHLIFE